MSKTPKTPQRRRKTKEEKLATRRAYIAAHRDEITAWQNSYNDKIMNDPVLRERKYAATKASRIRHYARWAAYDRSRDRTKLHARAFIRNRIYTGTLQRKSCVICGASNAQAHHENYEKHGEIIWLCPQHHAGVHSGIITVKQDWIDHVK